MPNTPSATVNQCRLKFRLNSDHRNAITPMLIASGAVALIRFDMRYSYLPCTFE